MSNSRKGRAISEATTPLNSNSGKVKHGSATPKKKMKRNLVDRQGQLNLVAGSANSSLGKRKANSKPIPESTSHDPFGLSEGCTPNKRKSNSAALVATPLKSRNPSGLRGKQRMNTKLTESNQSGQKKGSKVTKKPKSSASKTWIGRRGSTSQQKRKIEEALSGCPAAIFMTFSPGSTLPPKMN